MEFQKEGDKLYVDLTLRLPHGLHSRPSARLAQTSRQFKAHISLINENGEADAKSMLEILSLAPGPNTRLRIVANGPDAREALAALCGQLAGNQE